MKTWYTNVSENVLLKDLYESCTNLENPTVTMEWKTNKMMHMSYKQNDSCVFRLQQVLNFKFQAEEQIALLFWDGKLNNGFVINPSSSFIVTY